MGHTRPRRTNPAHSNPGLVFFEQNFPDPQHWNQSQLFATNRALDPDHLRSAISALIRRHDALRLRFTQTESGWQQTAMVLNVAIPYEVIDLAEKAAPSSWRKSKGRRSFNR